MGTLFRIDHMFVCTWTTWTKSSEGSLYTLRTEAIEKSYIEGINTRRELRFTLYIFFGKNLFLNFFLSFLYVLFVQVFSFLLFCLFFYLFFLRG